MASPELERHPGLLRKIRKLRWGPALRGLLSAPDIAGYGSTQAANP